MAGEQSFTDRIERPLTDVGKAYVNGLANSIMADFPA